MNDGRDRITTDNSTDMTTGGSASDMSDEVYPVSEVYLDEYVSFVGKEHAIPRRGYQRRITYLGNKRRIQDILFHVDC